MGRPPGKAFQVPFLKGGEEGRKRKGSIDGDNCECDQRSSVDSLEKGRSVGRLKLNILREESLFANIEKESDLTPRGKNRGTLGESLTPMGEPLLESFHPTRRRTNSGLTGVTKERGKGENLGTPRINPQLDGQIIDTRWERALVNGWKSSS